jgi:hypothetical protein
VISGQSQLAVIYHFNIYYLQFNEALEMTVPDLAIQLQRSEIFIENCEGM